MSGEGPSISRSTARPRETRPARIGAGTEQENLGNFTQSRQYLLKQDSTFATAYAPRKDQAQAWSQWWCRCAYYLARPC